MNKNPTFRRHLDHLQDITAGRHWTPIPEPLRTLWFHSRISDKKVKLIMIMLSHGQTFQIKRHYLEKTCKFHDKTLAKYLKEIVEDGIVRVEKLKDENGSTHNIYHTNPVSEWRLREALEDTPSEVRDTPTPSLVSPSAVSPSEVRGYNKKKGNQKKKNLNQMDGWNEPTQPIARGNPEPLEPHRDQDLVDPCKRIEYCYKSRETDYVDFKATAALLHQVRLKYGAQTLNAFIEWTEKRYLERCRISPLFSFRAERMPAHWEEFLAIYLARPDNPPCDASVH